MHLGENMSDSAELLISVSLDDADSEQLQKITHQLQSEINQLHIDSVEKVSAGDASEGTKSANWAEIGQMVVTLAPAIVPPLFDLLKSWVNRQPSTPVKIRIKVGKNKTAQIEYDPTKTSAEELENLVKTLGRSIKK